MTADSMGGESGFAGRGPTVREWGLRVLVSLFCVVCIGALFFVDHLQPLLDGWIGSRLAPARERALQWIGGLLAAGGVVFERAEDVFLLPSGSVQIGDKVWAMRKAPLVALVLLVGAYFAARTWPVGGFRRAVLLILSVVGPPVLLFFLDVLCLSAILWITAESGSPVGYTKYVLSSEARVFVAAAIVVGLWVFVKALVIEDGPGVPGAEADRCRNAAPPLLWGAMAGCALLLPASLVMAAGAATVERTLSLPIAFVVRGLLCATAAILLLFNILGYRGAGRLAWLPLIAIIFVGGDYATAGALTLTVVALNHKG